MSEAKWYVVHTYSGYENKVKANIDKTIENRHLEDQILEVRVPMQDVIEMKNGVQKDVYKRQNYGFINVFLEMIGQGDKAQAWLSNDKIVMALVAIPLVWQYIGYYMIIIMSAMSSVDPQIFEMAEIDGASGWKKAVYITLPLIKNTLIVCVTLCIAGNMKIFDLIYSLTGGGPGNSTSVMAMYAYKSSFLSYKMGYGSAMSIVILVVSLVVVGGSQLIMRHFTKEDE